jgi:hypothetical protein
MTTRVADKYFLKKIFFFENFVLLVPGWPTQIGLWAAVKIVKNIDFLGRIITKN